MRLTHAEVYALTMLAAFAAGGVVAGTGVFEELAYHGRRLAARVFPARLVAGHAASSRPRALEPREAAGSVPGAAGVMPSGAAPGAARTSTLLGSPDTWTRDGRGVLHPPAPPVPVVRPANGRTLPDQPRQHPSPRRQAGPRRAPALLTPEQLSVYERVADGLRNLDRRPVYGEAPQLDVDQAQRALGRADLGPADPRPFRDRVRAC